MKAIEFDSSSTGGQIKIGKFIFHWANPCHRFPGYTCISFGSTSLEFGDIDAGNGIFFVKYVNGELACHRTILKIN